MLFRWRDRVADRPIPIPIPEAIRRRISQSARRHSDTSHSPSGSSIDTSRSPIYVCSDWRPCALGGVFYVSTFIDLSEKVFRGTGTWTMLGTFFVFTTPQYLYYIVPLSVLLASLVTVAILTKNSELVVMKACGISLYRFALPMVAGAVAAGAFLFTLEQTVLGPANRRAQAIRHVLNGRLARDVRRAESPLGRGARRCDLSLHLLRSATRAASRACGSTNSTTGCDASTQRTFARAGDVHRQHMERRTWLDESVRSRR